MTTHSSLTSPPADLIGPDARPIPGEALVSTNPARPSEAIWSGSPDPGHVDDAVAAAREAQREWARWPRERRFEVLRRFRDLCRGRAGAIAALIRDEVGKAMWDATGEAAALAAKVDITLDESEHAGLRRVTGYDFELAPSRRGRCWFRPHGVMGVIGPFNFPAHLPNGHIVPALAMGNAVVFKPSDKTPATGQLLAELYREALAAEGAPLGLVNLVHGAAEPARRLTTHAEIDGILFTGSWPVGRRILEANLDNPSRIIALEMGGNNPAVVMPDADLRQAAIECVRSAFATTGQRCTCTRRLILHADIADALLPVLVKATSTLVIGDPASEQPVFMGPLVNRESRDGVLRFQQAAIEAGARPALEATAIPSEHDGHYITPGILRVDAFRPTESDDPGCDLEVFGPLLRVRVVDSLDEAIAQANATRFGLAASIFSSDRDTIERFLTEARAGCVNVNTGTAGASSKLPFGGIGLSGNHRPAGAFSLDYCAYPVAGMIERGDAATIPEGMTFDDDWLA